MSLNNTDSKNTNSNDGNANVKKKYIRKRKRFERFDGYKVKSVHSFQKLVPYIMKPRTASSNYFEATYDMAEVVKYLDEKNSILKEKNDPNNPIKKYTYALFFISLLVRIFALRPKLNRFISRKNIYQRHNIEVAYVIKKEFSDEGEESTAISSFERDFNIEDVGKVLFPSIKGVKNTTNDNAGDFVGLLMKFPNFVVSFIVWIFDALIYIGYCPAILRKIDVMQCSVMFSNLGSIGLDSVPHHHLYDRGTCSIFISIGRIRKELVQTNDGLVEKELMDIKITMDERIADGFYFVKTFDILNDIIKDPKRLDERLKEVLIDE
ncbi:MAG: 2-oxo acid dehydrogenase subunit E2 [Methanobrevibacter sp.]|jgi:hypothetical protein|nr:2-oxo acid dehydrogenase subunit E2 [Candidatus Methanovirga meridionalis]